MLTRLLASSLLALLVGCGAPDAPEPPAPPEAPASEQATSAAGSTATYEAKGVVRSVTPSGSHVMIRHGDIPGFMDAMTMAFAVADSSLVDGVARDDSVRFRFSVGPDGTLIREMTRVE